MYNHKKALNWAQLKVGIVVTTALLVLFITVLFAGNIGELFAPKTKIHATFKDVKGLRDRKSTRLNSSHIPLSRMPSSA